MSGTVYTGGTGSYGADGGIYGGAMSSSSGLATTGRPPQIGRNSIIGPGFNNFDFRVSRDVPIHENIRMQFIAEAFNLLNHNIITGVNATYSTYTAASATSTTCPTSASAPAGSPLQGCITPYAGTGTSAFGATNATNNTPLRPAPAAGLREAVLLTPTQHQTKSAPSRSLDGADFLCPKNQSKVGSKPNLVLQPLDHHIGRLDQRRRRIALLQMQLPHRARRDNRRNMRVPRSDHDLRQQSFDANADHLARDLIPSAHPAIALPRLRRRLRRILHQKRLQHRLCDPVVSPGVLAVFNFPVRIHCLIVG